MSDDLIARLLAAAPDAANGHILREAATALSSALKREIEMRERCAKVVKESVDDTIRAFILLTPESQQYLTLEQFAKAADEVTERIRALEPGQDRATPQERKDK